MPARKGLLAPQNTFLDTIATRFDGTHSNFVLGNAQAAGLYPIVYCSDGFCELTGFTRAQVMSKSCACKFLFGPETAEAEKEKIDDALEQKRELKTEVVLYSKSTSPFCCLLDIVPIKNEKGEVVFFLVSHKHITNQKSESSENLDNPVNVLGDMVKFSSNLLLASHKSITKGDREDRKGSTGSEGQDSEGSSLLPPGLAEFRARARSGIFPPPSGGGDDDDDAPPINKYHGQRRRSRAVLYQLSGTFDRQKNVKSKMHLDKIKNLSGNTALPEYKVQDAQRSRFVLLHHGIFKIGWDWLILLCTFYIAIIVPYNAAFITAADHNSGSGRASIVTDVIVEILFIVDIVLNFRTTYVSKGGKVIYESKLIAVNYIRGWFLLDFLPALPFDLLYAFQVNTGTWIHLLKGARLLRLGRLLQKLDRYSQYSVVVLTLLMAMFTVLAHWFACIWYCIGSRQLQSHPANWTVGWLFQLAERLDKPIQKINDTTYNLPTTHEAYVSALYFACTSLTSVGFGNVSANTNIEKIFSIIAMLIGAMMHAVVFGNITAMIQRMYARRITYQSKERDLKDFLRAHHISKPLKHRMQEYFSTMWSLNSGVDAEQVMKDFPVEMQGEISMHLYREIFALPIFETASQGCLKMLALQTKSMFCAPNEILLHKGDALNYIYFVCNGSMEILKDGLVVAILGKSDLFGTDLEYPTETIQKSTCEVKSMTYCDLQCINTKGLMDSLAQYQEFGETFRREIQHDLTFNLREGMDNEETNVNGGLNMLPAITEDDEEEEDEEDCSDKEETNSSTNVDQPPSSPQVSKRPDLFSLEKLRTSAFLRPSRFGRPNFRSRKPESNSYEAFTERRRRSFEMKKSNLHHGRRSLYNLQRKSEAASGHITEIGETDDQLQDDDSVSRDSRRSSATTDNMAILRDDVAQTQEGMKQLNAQIETLSRDVRNLNQDVRSILGLMRSRELWQAMAATSGSHGMAGAPPAYSQTISQLQTRSSETLHFHPTARGATADLVSTANNRTWSLEHLHSGESRELEQGQSQGHSTEEQRSPSPQSETHRNSDCSNYSSLHQSNVASPSSPSSSIDCSNTSPTPNIPAQNQSSGSLEPQKQSRESNSQVSTSHLLPSNAFPRKLSAPSEVVNSTAIPRNGGRSYSLPGGQANSIPLIATQLRSSKGHAKKPAAAATQSRKSSVAKETEPPVGSSATNTPTSPKHLNDTLHAAVTQPTATDFSQPEPCTVPLDDMLMLDENMAEPLLTTDL